MTDKTLQEFKALLDQCREQVEHDPEGFTSNPHLYEMQHKILLRLCHGNIPEFISSDEKETTDKFAAAVLKHLFARIGVMMNEIDGAIEKMIEGSDDPEIIDKAAASFVRVFLGEEQSGDN